jgi:hypothetical protein
MASLEADWEKFSADPDWKQLSADPKFNLDPPTVPPKIAAERVEILLREPSAVLRFQTLEALRALGSSIITPILAESASKSLQDEAEAVREMAWGVVENYMKHAGAST